MRKTAIVTGGSSGIGRETCFRFAEEGYSVVVADIQREPREGGRPTHEVIEDEGGDASFVETDIRGWEEVQELVEKAVEWYGSIDVLVNNAGFAEKGPIEDTSIEDARKIFRVNAEGVYHGMKAVVPHMKEEVRGSIVNVSSVAGKKPSPGHVAYSGAKHAVIGMTNSLAKELEGTEIRVNAVCPGRTATAMTGFEGTSPEKVADTILEVIESEGSGRAVDV
ncbi:MAG: SDR family oxidoreductase [Candidatus Nanohaloarchaea archaeon]|nr:SDR family oxidoreductase [Candidatus Nanohaloarchaea archaeon]